MFLFNNKLCLNLHPSSFTSFYSATVNYSPFKNSPRPTLAFKFRRNFFSKHVTFNNFSKLLYLSQSISQQIFPWTDTGEKAGIINTFPISWFKSEASPHSDFGHSSSPSHINDGPFHHSTSSNFGIFLYFVATSAEL